MFEVMVNGPSTLKRITVFILSLISLSDQIVYLLILLPVISFLELFVQLEYAEKFIFVAVKYFENGCVVSLD